MFKKFDVTIALFVFENALQSSITLVEVYAWQLSVNRSSYAGKIISSLPPDYSEGSILTVFLNSNLYVVTAPTKIGEVGCKILSSIELGFRLRGLAFSVPVSIKFVRRCDLNVSNLN